MATNFFFYDLETSGINPRRSRVMQFAGQRTDMNLKPIGEPYNFLIKLSDDVLPDPYAILVTGITPQKTVEEGITEAEFTDIFVKEIAAPDTIFVGFNSIRFDDEFMRFLLYRNFYDAYEWQWKDGRSRWDLLDVVRLTRALRPDGIKWPFDSSGAPSNRLELISSVNNLVHDNAHDAMSDVEATIEVARMIKSKQPKLFDYLLTMRDKRQVQNFVSGDQAFLYASGKYPAQFEKTAAVMSLGPHPDKQGVLVYDLRHDPKDFVGLSPEKLAEAWRWDPETKSQKLPIKSLQFNRCPAIAPLSVLDNDSQKRLEIDPKKVESNRQILLQNKKEFTDKLAGALKIINSEREQRGMLVDEKAVDTMLYDSFIPNPDRALFAKFHSSAPENISEFKDKFEDPRLKSLVPLYKARNYPKFLTSEEKEAWEKYRQNTLFGGGEKSPFALFMKRLTELSEKDQSKEKQYLLEELQLWGQSIMPDLGP